jgi:hypothetical protein
MTPNPADKPRSGNKQQQRREVITVTANRQTISAKVLSEKLGRAVILPGPFPVLSQNVTDDEEVEVKILYGGDVETITLSHEDFLELDESETEIGNYSPVWGSA